MNTKRQTVWLVSMLGLMVVLSAYYLFSGNVSKKDLTAQGLNANSNKQANVKEVNAGKNSATAQNGSTQASAGDQKILDQLAAQTVSGNDYFMTTQMQQDDNYKKAYEKLMAITQDKSQSTSSIEKAYNQMDQLEQTENKINDLESKLTKNYKSAVISQQNNKYIVAVEADKLEKSQAVSIADMVMKELNISPDQIVVRYLQ